MLPSKTAYSSFLLSSELDAFFPKGIGVGEASIGAVDMARGVGSGLGEILVILASYFFGMFAEYRVLGSTLLLFGGLNVTISNQEVANL